MLNAERYLQVKELFLAASNRTPAERLSFLDEACGGDLELRTEVESLLQHDDSAQEFLQTPALQGGLDLATAEIFATRIQPIGRKTAPRSRPARIGGYTIIDVLGEGGMGVVYLAEQQAPRRRVALKVIRPGLASADVLRRFEFETKLLARLQHPGIAQIFEAGTFDEGDGPQPFYSMELVEGQPLSAFMDEHVPEVSLRVKLLIHICQAVHHAHQKGIIHRDLKPGNILVSPSDCHDVAGHPKILDFGVARAVQADDRQTLQTGAGQLIGTISYMSPEQVAGDPDDLDTRSDVYALGVIGFEMLTRRLPHDFNRCSIPECARIIRDEEPLRLGEVDPKLRGDLESIFVKALEKQPSRRYQSASDFAEDLARFLERRPVAARRSTWLYRQRKRVERHPKVSAGLGVALVLAIGASATVWSLSSSLSAAMFEKGGQVQSAVAAGQKYGTAIAQVQLAISQLHRNQDRPSADVLRELLAILNAQAADAENANDLEAAASLYSTTGLGYQQLGMYDHSLAQYRRALEARQRIAHTDNPALAEAWHNLGKGHYWNNDFNDAEQAYQRALEMRIRLFGDRDWTVALTTTHLATCAMQRGEYDRAEQLFRQALEIRRAIPHVPPKDIGASLNNLGACLYSAGRYAEALNLYQQAFDLIGDPADDLEWKPRSLRNMAMALIELNRLDEAEVLLLEALGMQEQRLNRPQIAVTQQQLARLRFKQARFQESLELLHEALGIQDSMLVQDHLSLAETRLLLGRTLLAMNDARLAEQLMRDALSARTSRLPADHWLIADAQSVLGEAVLAQDRAEEAQPLLETAYARLKSVRPAEDSHVQEALARLQLLEQASIDR